MKIIKSVSSLLLLSLLLGCSYIAPYDQKAYENATDLKVEAVHLVKKSTQEYAAHAEDVELFQLEMLKAYEYVKNMPKNIESTKQYEILLDEEGKSMFGFLKFWQEKGTVSEFMAQEYAEEIEKHFNELIRLEAGKIGGKN